ncbi:FBXO9 [Acanthosepion pharaonis]|uniref:F-box only protein 9 n=1 Tax=Acanthosepion pharaonis TaxID=158019 RepID=A0A812CD20_ACAPH|nr:FBXO9 [Sepia pharaonis]
MEEENLFPSPSDVEASEGEEEEEEEPPEYEDVNEMDEALSLERQLDDFRMRWQQELLVSQNSEESSNGAAVPGSSADTNHDRVLRSVDNMETVKNKAQWFYLEGIKAEQNGNLYDAVSFYRQAVQLVPDIEFQVNLTGQKPRQRQVSETSVGSNTSVEDLEESLQNQLNQLQASQNTICQAATEQRGTHISSLPVEVVMYIFKWVVSTELDTRSLEQLSQVCRGFYLCARDEELWKLVCTKIFKDVNCRSYKKYGSWRNMYYQKPHVRHNGCYISKCSYIRQGEKGLDHFYKPWHLVEYYRFVRFFPSGEIVMMSSPEEPSVCIPKLNIKSKHASMLTGFYRLSGNTITAVLTRVKSAENTNQYNRRNRRNCQNENEEAEQKFNVEFNLVTAGRRKFAKLQWKHYSARTFYRSSNGETVVEFELSEQNYPPLYFSRVKSFTCCSHMPLE